MPEIQDLPHITAALNALTAVFLVIGYVHIRQGRRAAHKKAMLTAVAVAVLFLIVYVIYHLNSGLARFGGVGVVRYVYFTLLIIHVIGAVVLVPLVPVTLYRALRGRFDAHKRLARWTWPLWMFVSVSGVVVYVMGFHLYPMAA